MAGRRMHECAECGYQRSVTAGTIFHNIRTSLPSWFWAIYRMSYDKKGIPAMQLSKEIGVSYPMAWLMQHKIRKAMQARDQSYKLSGLVEVDEGYVGGSKKVLAAVAVAHRANRLWPSLSNSAHRSSQTVRGKLAPSYRPGRCSMLTDCDRRG